MVAREAATLLYTSQEKEYKQAKVKPRKTVGASALPSNREIAEEIDCIASFTEGSARKERLVKMRKEALQILETLKDFQSRLVGSVWRGTAHHNSDIDVVTFSPDPKIILMRLQKAQFKIIKKEWRSVSKGGKMKASFHIHITLPSGNEAEVVVRNQEKSDVNRCEIYGDIMTGLSSSQLQRVLRENPLQRFMPKYTS
jgi:predicted nucleotidyltransferase